MILADAFYSCVDRDRRSLMSTIKTLAIAAALAVGASSLAMPSLAMAQQTGNPAGNAAMSGGSGNHQSSEKTGSASNSQKVQKNQNGYQGGHQ
jgi:hypothetical protein